MERTPIPTDPEDLDSCVAKFLARHGVQDEDDGDAAPTRETEDETIRDVISSIETASSAIGKELTMELSLDRDEEQSVEEQESVEPSAERPTSDTVVSDVGGENGLATDDVEAAAVATNEESVDAQRPRTNETPETIRDLRHVANSISTNVLGRYQKKQGIQQAFENAIWAGAAAATSALLNVLSPSVSSLMFWMSSVALALSVYGLLRSARLIREHKRR